MLLPLGTAHSKRPRPSVANHVSEQRMAMDLWPQAYTFEFKTFTGLWSAQGLLHPLFKMEHSVMTSGVQAHFFAYVWGHPAPLRRYIHIRHSPGSHVLWEASWRQGLLAHPLGSWLQHLNPPDPLLWPCEYQSSAYPMTAMAWEIQHEGRPSSCPRGALQPSLRDDAEAPEASRINKAMWDEGL